MNSQIPQAIFQIQTHAGVRQDKYAPERVYKASGQPVTPTTPARTGGSNFSGKHHGSNKRKTKQIAGWVLPPTKARIQSIAKQQGISESKVVRALVDKALQFDADMQYGAMIRPVIEDAIGKRMRARDNRLAALLVRVAFDAGQTRNLVTNLLNIQPEMTSDDLKTILTESARSAKGNITRRTPQIAELIEEVEQWMRREGENETK